MNAMRSLHCWFAGATFAAAVALGPAALARTVNNCDLHTGTRGALTTSWLGGVMFELVHDQSGTR